MCSDTVWMSVSGEITDGPNTETTTNDAHNTNTAVAAPPKVEAAQEGRTFAPTFTYHVVEKDVAMVPEGTRVYCQGRFGSINKVGCWADGTHHFVKITFDDGSEAHQEGKNGSTAIKLDGTANSPCVFVEPPLPQS